MYYQKVLLQRFWLLPEINSRFSSKTQWQMFRLVSGRHVGAHLIAWRLHCIQISLNFGKMFLLISCNCCDPNLGESLCMFTFFLFSDSELYLLIITQVILALWLVLAYNLLEDRRTIDVIITKCFKMAERFENLDNILRDGRKKRGIKQEDEKKPFLF